MAQLLYNLRRTEKNAKNEENKEDQGKNFLNRRFLIFNQKLAKLQTGYPYLNKD